MYKVVIRLEEESKAVEMAKRIEKEFLSVEGEVKVYKETDLEITPPRRVKPSLTGSK